MVICVVVLKEFKIWSLASLFIVTLDYYNCLLNNQHYIFDLSVVRSFNEKQTFLLEI